MLALWNHTDAFLTQSAGISLTHPARDPANRQCRADCNVLRRVPPGAVPGSVEGRRKYGRSKVRILHSTPFHLLLARYCFCRTAGCGEVRAHCNSRLHGWWLLAVRRTVNGRSETVVRRSRFEPLRPFGSSFGHLVGAHRPRSSTRWTNAAANAKPRDEFAGLHSFATCRGLISSRHRDACRPVITGFCVALLEVSSIGRPPFRSSDYGYPPPGIEVSRLASPPWRPAPVPRLGITLKHRVEGGHCAFVSGTPATWGAHNSETSMQQPNHQLV